MHGGGGRDYCLYLLFVCYTREKHDSDAGVKGHEDQIDSVIDFI